jgi:hypothetical protein
MDSHWHSKLALFAYEKGEAVARVPLVTQATDCPNCSHNSVSAGGRFSSSEVQNFFLEVKCAGSPWPSCKMHVCCQQTVLMELPVNACK